MRASQDEKERPAGEEDLHAVAVPPDGAGEVAEEHGEVAQLLEEAPRQVGVAPVEDADLVERLVHVALVARVGRVPLGVGEEGDEERHPLAAVGAAGRPQRAVHLVELEDAGAAKNVAAVRLHRQPRRIVADRALLALGTDAAWFGWKRG